jgi:nicotinamidase-related amidase
MLIHRHRSHLLLVDLQERLLPAIPEGESALRRARVLVEAAAHLDVPISVTEQYPQGIGPSSERLRDALPQSATTHEKITFAASADPAFAEHVGIAREAGRDQLVIAGTEAHVCVLQTALGFRELGYEVFVVADAVASRDPASVLVARDRLVQPLLQHVELQRADHAHDRARAVDPGGRAAPRPPPPAAAAPRAASWPSSRPRS